MSGRRDDDGRAGGPSPTAPAPRVHTAPAEGSRHWWAAIPRRLGHARTSTVVLAVLFVALGLLYLYVRPESTEVVPVVDPVPAVDTGDAPAPTSPTVPETDPPTTSAPPTTSPTTSPDPTGSATPGDDETMPADEDDPTPTTATTPGTGSPTPSLPATTTGPPGNESAPNT